MHTTMTCLAGPAKVWWRSVGRLTRRQHKREEVGHVTHCCLCSYTNRNPNCCTKSNAGFIEYSNTLLALSGRARGRSSISESASAAAFAFPVAISFLFCNFLHNRQRFSANFGPIILVPIFFCPDFPSFKSFSPLKCAWWDCFRTRVTATLLAN